MPDEPISTAQFEQFYPIICLSASRYTSGGSSERYGNFNYVPGSGDDHEGWVPQGFGPQLFWKNKDEILACNRDQLYFYMEELVAKATKLDDKGPQKQTEGDANTVWIVDAFVGYRVHSKSFRLGSDAHEVVLYIGATWLNDEIKASKVFAVPQDPKKHLQYFTVHIEEIEKSIAEELAKSRPIMLVWPNDSTSNERDFGIGILLVALCE